MRCIGKGGNVCFCGVNEVYASACVCVDFCLILVRLRHYVFMLRVLSSSSLVRPSVLPPPPFSLSLARLFACSLLDLILFKYFLGCVYMKQRHKFINLYFFMLYGSRMHTNESCPKSVCRRMNFGK